MRTKYNELFKTIITSYYEGTFDETIKKTLSDETIDKNYLSSVISSLCGVTVNYTDNFVSDLKKAIENYDIDHKIVSKVTHCSMDCVDENGKTLCQKSCPFDAILVDKSNHTTYISTDKCLDCGLCVEGCPDGSILDKVEFIPLLNLLKDNKPVIAAVAPAIAGQFGANVSLDKLRTAFQKLGFDDMIEVAFFADMLTLKESIEFDEHVKTKNDLMITSCCCPMWVGMLRKIYNNLVKHVSPSVSPMIAAGRVIKKLNPNCKVVFIGPCIAKKAEAKAPDLKGDIDFVLTFTEVKEIFDAFNINPETLNPHPSSEYASREGRLYARTGGVSISVSEAISKMFPEKYKLLSTVQANGVKECKELLEKAQNGELDFNFIEGMGCNGGCVGGPKALISKDEGTEHVNKFADSSKVKISLNSDCMKNILKKIGISSIEDFKNKKNTEIFERKF